MTIIIFMDHVCGDFLASAKRAKFRKHVYNIITQPAIYRVMK